MTNHREEKNPLRSNSDLDALAKLANKIRIHAVRMTSSGKSSHVGSVLSIADILAVLYGQILRVNPKDPSWSDRDRFILAKGHAGAGVYAALAETGFFPTQLLTTHYQNGSTLSGHISHKGIPGVELSTGSLGHGLGIGVGMAYAGKLRHASHRVFVVMSDGECDEGSNWEAIQFAGHHQLENLIAIVDYNKIQSLGLVSETLALEPFADKWRAFNWNVREVNGHDLGELRDCLNELPFSSGKPNCVIAHTVKGKGVSFMENAVLWHYRSPQGEELKAALTELNGIKDA